jgi:hypothetical protein
VGRIPNGDVPPTRLHCGKCPSAEGRKSVLILIECASRLSALTFRLLCRLLDENSEGDRSKEKAKEKEFEKEEEKENNLGLGQILSSVSTFQHRVYVSIPHRANILVLDSTNVCLRLGADKVCLPQFTSGLLSLPKRLRYFRLDEVQCLHAPFHEATTPMPPSTI